MDALNMAAQVAIHGLAVVATTFVVFYIVRSDWKANAGGRSVMIMAFTFAFFVDEVTVRIWLPLPDVPLRRVFDLFTYVAILASWIWLLVNLIRFNWKPPRDNEKDGSDDTH